MDSIIKPPDRPDLLEVLLACKRLLDRLVKW